MTNNLLYFDTTIWNQLSDQNPEAAKFCHHLAERDAEIVLGLNAYFEMLRAFYGKRPDSGKKLFSSLHRFLAAGVRIIKTWEELLVQEVKSISEETGPIDLFLGKDWHTNLLAAARDLSMGKPHVGTQGLLAKRQAHSEDVRNLASQSISSQADFVSDLRSIEPGAIGEYLNVESRGSAGRRLLAKYLTRIVPMFNQTVPEAPEELGGKLLASISNRVANAIVRSDMYQNWRAARGKSVRRCVPDDSYHVVNAAYCQVFVTEDSDGQAGAAAQAIPGIRVLIYRDRAIPLLTWLLELLNVQYKLASS